MVKKTPALAEPAVPQGAESKPSAATRRPSSLVDTRIIYCGDNLEQPTKLPDACVDLIYIAPPFNSNRNYEVFWGETREKRAFADRHASTQAYIEYMRPRCMKLARVLKKTGSFYYHCDWHASHYVKSMRDQIFGENIFQNEIIWKRTSAHAETHGFGHVHDIIFRYSNGGPPVFNPQLKDYSQDYVENYFIHEDEHTGTRGKYRLNDLTGSGLRHGETGKPRRGIDRAKIGKGRHWMRTPDELEEMAADVPPPRLGKSRGGCGEMRPSHPALSRLLLFQLAA